MPRHNSIAPVPPINSIGGLEGKAVPRPPYMPSPQRSGKSPFPNRILVNEDGVQLIPKGTILRRKRIRRTTKGYEADEQVLKDSIDLMYKHKVGHYICNAARFSTTGTGSVPRKYFQEQGHEGESTVLSADTNYGSFDVEQAYQWGSTNAAIKYALGELKIDEHDIIHEMKKKHVLEYNLDTMKVAMMDLIEDTQSEQLGALLAAYELFDADTHTVEEQRILKFTICRRQQMNINLTSQKLYNIALNTMKDTFGRISSGGGLFPRKWEYRGVRLYWNCLSNAKVARQTVIRKYLLERDLQEATTKYERYTLLLKRYAVANKKYTFRYILDEMDFESEMEQVHSFIV